MISVLKSYKMRKIPTNGFDFRPKKNQCLYQQEETICYQLATQKKPTKTTPCLYF